MCCSACRRAKTFYQTLQTFTKIIIVNNLTLTCLNKKFLERGIVWTILLHSLRPTRFEDKLVPETPVTTFKRRLVILGEMSLACGYFDVILINKLSLNDFFWFVVGGEIEIPRKYDIWKGTVIAPESYRELQLSAISRSKFPQ